jgi:hypothetical protein
MFFFRVYHIVKNQSHRVIENGNSFIKSNSMFAKIAIRLARVPRKFHISVYFFFFAGFDAFLPFAADFFGALFLFADDVFGAALLTLPFEDAFAGFLPFTSFPLRDDVLFPLVP